MQIVRGDNRDKSGINGDFLCIKGRYGFDFAGSRQRLTQPLIRRAEKLVAATWEEALETVALKFKEVRELDGGKAIGVIGSTRTVNEADYLLQKFARVVLQTNNIDHHRTADYPALAAALGFDKNAPGEPKDGARGAQTASMRDVFFAPATLLIGNNPTDEHPLLAWQIRTNVRLRKARLYVVNAYPIKLRRQATAFAQVTEDGGEAAFVRFLAGNDSAPANLGAAGTTADQLTQLRDQLRGEQDLVVIFGSELRANSIAELVRALPNAKFVCLGDYANSRGAADMGLYPDLLPGYTPLSEKARYEQEWGAEIPSTLGKTIGEMVAGAKDGSLKAMYIVGSNPVVRYSVDPFALQKPFVVVQDMFLTETAILADVVLPAANAYEKEGTFTNTCGDLQLLRKAGDMAGTQPDFEIIVRIAERMGFDVSKLVPFGQGMRADMGQSRGAQSGEADRHAVWLEAHNLEPKMSPLDPIAILDEIQRLVPGYDVSRLNLLAGNDEHVTSLEQGRGITDTHPELIVPSQDTLFTSGTLGRYSDALSSVIESRRKLPADKEVPV
jgi:NADH-quinone oxidoreductase subunit G